MAASSWYKHGDYNAVCDVCGFEFKASKMRKNWQGLFVDDACYEPRHPLDFIRTRPEKASVPVARPEAEDINIEICYLWERSSYADLATADCATADTVTFTYPYLLALSQGTS